MQRTNIRLILLFTIIFICNIVNGEIVTTCKKTKYVMPNDSIWYVYKVSIINNDSSLNYLTWFDDHDISKQTEEEIKKNHFLKAKGDFNLLDFLYEDMVNDSTNINKKFRQEYLIKEIHPKGEFTYYIFSRTANEKEILNKVAIVTDMILGVPLAQRIGGMWLYEEKECIIFDKESPKINN